MAHSFPDFSIIIPTRERLHSLRNCLKGLARIDYPSNRYEAVVVNDGGPFLKKEDVAPLRGLKNLHVLNQQNKGPASARNAGVLMAKGEYLAFLDDDCAPSPEWLKTLAKRVACGDRSAVGGRTVNLLADNPFAVASQMMVDYLYGVMNEKPEKARFLATNNLAVPKDRFLSMGGFDPCFTRAAGEDRDFCRRWIQHGYPMIYVPEALVFHAHDLRFRDYLRQHFGYGQGAFRYHRGGRRGPFSGLGTPAFYWNLVIFPLRRQETPGKCRLIFFMALSQAATAAGIAYGLGSAALKSLRHAAKK